MSRIVSTLLQLGSGVRPLFPEAVLTVDQEFTWPGGEGYVVCEYSTGGGTVSFQVQSTSGVWIDTDISFEQDSGIKLFKLPPEINTRLHLEGLNSSTHIFAQVYCDTRRHSTAIS